MKSFLLIVLFAGCAVYPDMKKRSFSYHLNDKKDIVFFVPEGYVQEQVKLHETKGLEQFYQYNHGAYFYIAQGTSLASINKRFITTGGKTEKNGSEFMYSGTDESGLYWKEVQVDSLRWGYSFVPVNLLPKFEQSVNSIRIKKQSRQ